MPVEEKPRQDAEAAPLSDLATAPRHALVADPSEVTHFVCCRTEPWDVAMCGYDISQANLNFVGDTCAMCIEVVLEQWRSRGDDPLDEQCPYDTTPCPSDEWLFNRVARETS